VRGVRLLVGAYAVLVALSAPAALLAAGPEEPATSGGAVIAPETEGGEAQAPASRQATHDVAMRNFKFVPREITVDVGDTVTWTNEDSAEHNAIAEDDSFRTPTFGEGETASVTINQAGTFPYFCSLHANMEGRISTTGSEPPAGGGSGGGGSGGGGSAGTGGSGSGSTSGDTSPLFPGDPGAAAGSGAGTGAGSSAGGGNSTLPFSGADSLWLAIAGGWLLVVGVAVRAAVAGRV
jgi:plastocyanin